MEKVRTYKVNRLLASVITLMIVAGVFSIDIEKLLRFYADSELLLLVFVAFVVMPLFLFLGFRIQLFRDRIAYRHNMFFRKTFKIADLSHILYQPTWRGVTSLDSQTNMRSLHIVRHSGGWWDTISLANGAYREEDLADLAWKLSQMNPQIELDEHAQSLIKRYDRTA